MRFKQIPSQSDFGKKSFFHLPLSPSPTFSEFVCWHALTLHDARIHFHSLELRRSQFQVHSSCLHSMRVHFPWSWVFRKRVWRRSNVNRFRLLKNLFNSPFSLNAYGTEHVVVWVWVSHRMFANCATKHRLRQFLLSKCDEVRSERATDERKWAQLWQKGKLLRA